MHFYATGTPKMQSQKRNFTILQLQDFLVNYELYEMLILLDSIFRCLFLYVLKILNFLNLRNLPKGVLL
jgi:predicted CDP-diglyceride synthetase/phosphatidate cytidylyltransferase